MVSGDELLLRAKAAQRVLQGEAPSVVAADHGISVEELEQWRRHYLGDRDNSRHRIKRLVARWPQLEAALKREWYRWQIKRGRFGSDEAEFRALDELVRPGDWVLDVGANIGTFTRRLSDLVGVEGRVVAFEPIISTFSLLVGNVADRGNVTLFNVAVSERSARLHMAIPAFGSGLRSSANAVVIKSGSGLAVLSLALDSFDWPARIALIKVDTEGHELEALRGMRGLLSRDHPTLIVEINDVMTMKMLDELGYERRRLSGGATIFVAAGGSPVTAS
jgi:FkbM family methyltransferase